MPDKSTVCTISFPGGVHKRFEKTRSRMVYHAIWGLGEITPTSCIVSNDITMPRLPRLSEPFSVTRRGNSFPFFLSPNGCLGFLVHLSSQQANIIQCTGSFTIGKIIPPNVGYIVPNILN